MPIRVLDTDEPRALLEFARGRFRAGGAAIATLTGIRGGAARALGAHVVVGADGGYAGFVSGGCVEAAVAAEALLALAEGRDRVVTYGEGSPFFDIVLPCGGGITVAIHVLRGVQGIDRALERLARRQAAGLRYAPRQRSLTCVPPPGRAGWAGADFVSVYRPVTRLVISGQGIEADSLARLARCAGHEVVTLGPRHAGPDLQAMIDAHTAVAVLHHDPEAELPILRAALKSPAFYIGALGGLRTQRARVDRLRGLGIPDAEIARIKGPIGMFGPARDANSLAISVLADVAAARLAVYA